MRTRSFFWLALAALGCTEPRWRREPAFPEVSSPGLNETLIHASGKEDLSADFPSGQVGAQTSTPRLRVPWDWEPDARVIEEWQESVPAAGGIVSAKLHSKLSVSPGERFVVYRLAHKAETDTTSEGEKFLIEVGAVEAVGPGARRVYRFRVLPSGDSPRPGDMLKRG